jgi:hypothetical protein
MNHDVGLIEILILIKTIGILKEFFPLVFNLKRDVV